MSDIKINEPIQSAQFEAVVIRCRCGNPSKVHPNDVCPLGERVNLGVIAYRHKNPLRTWAFRVRRKLFELTHPELYR